MPRKKLKLAIFDIDGTIFRSSLLIELFNALVAKRIFPAKAKAQVEREYLAWLNRQGHYNDYLYKLVAVHYKYQVGLRQRDIASVAREVVAWQKNRVYRYTRDLIRDLKRRGYFLIAISNSQDLIVSRFAKALGFHAAIGRHLEVKNGIYTGRIISNGETIERDEHVDKVKILKNFIREQRLNANLKQSVAVGDSEGDIELLKTVGRPIAFNPSDLLLHHAKKHNWEIVVERKNVAYRIKKSEFITFKK